MEEANNTKANDRTRSETRLLPSGHATEVSSCTLLEGSRQESRKPACGWMDGWMDGKPKQKQLSLESSTQLERIFRFGFVQSDGTTGSFCGFLYEATRRSAFPWSQGKHQWLEQKTACWGVCVRVCMEGASSAEVRRLSLLAPPAVSLSPVWAAHGATQAAAASRVSRLSPLLVESRQPR